MEYTIVNYKNSFNTRSGNIKVYVDNKAIATLETEETIIDVSPGTEIYLKLQWCYSNKIKLSKETNKIFVNSFLNNQMFVLILSLCLIFTMLALLTKFTFFAYLPIIVTLYPMYYITFGYKRYLRLSYDSFK